MSLKTKTCHILCAVLFDTWQWNRVHCIELPSANAIGDVSKFEGRDKFVFMITQSHWPHDLRERERERERERRKKEWFTVRAAKRNPASFSLWCMPRRSSIQRWLPPRQRQRKEKALNCQPDRYISTRSAKFWSTHSTTLNGRRKWLFCVSLSILG